MKKPFFILTVLILLAIICCLSCSKDGDKAASGDYYIASPEKMMDMAGKDWNTLKPGLEGKKGYWYTEFTADQNPTVKAVISLPALEETHHEVVYRLLLNINRYTNKDGGPFIDTDTLTQLSYNTAASLMLEYYNRAIVLTGDPITSYGASIPEGGLATGSSGGGLTTVAAILDALNSGTVADQYTIDIVGKKKGFQVVLSKYTGKETYWFRFQSADY